MSSTRLGAALGVVVLAATLLGAFAAPASAAEASGCSGSGVSFDGEGLRIDAASAPGPGGTKANPFDVTTDGRVRYRYRVGAPVAGGTWKVKIDTGLFPISFGGDISPTAKQSGRGVEPLKKHLRLGPLAMFVGLMKVDIEASGPSGGTCVVSGWIKIHSSVLTTPAFYLGLILAVLGLLLMFFSMGRAT